MTDDIKHNFSNAYNIILNIKFQLWITNLIFLMLCVHKKKAIIKGNISHARPLSKGQTTKWT